MRTSPEYTVHTLLDCALCRTLGKAAMAYPHDSDVSLSHRKTPTSYYTRPTDRESATKHTITYCHEDKVHQIVALEEPSGPLVIKQHDERVRHG